jgi:hypothetical protein
MQIDRFYIRNGVAGLNEAKQEALAPSGIPIYRDILGPTKMKAMKAGDASLLVERASMLRPTSRENAGERIGVAAIHVIGFSVDDFLDALSAAWARGSVFVDVSTGKEFHPGMKAAEIAAAGRGFQRTRKSRQTEAGREANHAMAVEKWEKKREKALAIARPLWGAKDSPSAAIIAEQAGCSVRLLYDNLGPRSRAKARQARREKRK